MYKFTVIQINIHLSPSLSRFFTFSLKKKVEMIVMIYVVE
jgi:hypothetical protein